MERKLAKTPFQALPNGGQFGNVLLTKFSPPAFESSNANCRQSESRPNEKARRFWNGSRWRKIKFHKELRVVPSLLIVPLMMIAVLATH